MICAPEQFLLVLQKWITDSASVGFTFLLSGDDTTPVPALSVTGRGRFLGIDPARNVMMSSADAVLIAIRVDSWSEIHYLDKSDIPRIKGIDGGFRLKQSGVSLDLLLESSDE